MFRGEKYSYLCSYLNNQHFSVCLNRSSCSILGYYLIVFVLLQIFKFLQTQVFDVLYRRYSLIWYHFFYVKLNFVEV